MEDEATGLEDTWILVIGLLYFGVAEMKGILVIVWREGVVGERSGVAPPPVEEEQVVAIAMVLSVRMSSWFGLVKKNKFMNFSFEFPLDQMGWVSAWQFSSHYY